MRHPEIGIDLSLGVLTLSPQRLASLPEPPEILATGFQLDVQQNSVPHRANLPLKLSVRAQPKLLPAFPARSQPGAIRLLGQDHGAADQLPGNSMKRDGDELFFHCRLSQKCEFLMTYLIVSQWGGYRQRKRGQAQGSNRSGQR